MAVIMSLSRVGSTKRSRLSAVLRQAGNLVRVSDAATALGIGGTQAAKLLARWSEQGWLKRLRRGLYAAVPLVAEGGDQVVDDPWRLVPELFAPAYVGGASAAHHWDLTEQLFRSMFVFTVRPLRSRNQSIEGIPFVLRHVSPAKMFGARSVWRGSVKVDVSDAHRTIIDMLDDPSCGGGIRHVADCLRAYFARDDASPETLVQYAKRLGNGAVFKRLGFLAERQGRDASIVDQCLRSMTKGNAKLDPAIASPRLMRRWRLWVPESWKMADRD